MNNNMTEEEKQIVSLYEKGLSFREVSVEMNITSDRVKYVCKKFKVRRNKLELTCKHCNKKFKALSNRHKFCSDTCRGSHFKRNRGIKQVCEWCNNKFTRYYERRFCSNKCRSLYCNYASERKELMVRLVRAIDTNRHKQCAHCGDSFYAHNLQRKHCSDRCSYRSRYEHHIQVKHDHICKECGKKYTDFQSNSAGCSEQCKRRYANRRSAYNRDARIKNNGPIDWDISVATIVARYGTLCYICGEHTDDEDYIINDEGHFIAGNNFPSIDHVIPISKGGTHQWENVKLAHRMCNSIKSDNEIDKEALLL